MLEASRRIVRSAEGAGIPQPGATPREFPPITACGLKGRVRLVIGKPSNGVKVCRNRSLESWFIWCSARNIDKLFMTPELRAELQPYLATVLDDNGCPSLQIGGVADHVHCLFGLSRTLTVAQVVELAKTSTSKWLETKGPAMATFSWQSGYGAFSVSESSANVVIAYIRNQEQHHGKLLFQDEFRALLQRHGIPYDERYVWD